MNALIPEDFNLHIETTGNIFGQNHGDSKLVSMETLLHSKDGSINVRKLRSDKCSLKGDGV